MRGGRIRLAVAVLLVNAVLAVAIGCSLYIIRYLYRRLLHRGQATPEQQLVKVAVGQAR